MLKEERTKENNRLEEKSRENERKREAKMKEEKRREEKRREEKEYMREEEKREGITRECLLAKGELRLSSPPQGAALRPGSAGLQWSSMGFCSTVRVSEGAELHRALLQTAGAPDPPPLIAGAQWTLLTSESSGNFLDSLTDNSESLFTPFSARPSLPFSVLPNKLNKLFKKLI